MTGLEGPGYVPVEGESWTVLKEDMAERQVQLMQAEHLIWAQGETSSVERSTRNTPRGPHLFEAASLVPHARNP